MAPQLIAKFSFSEAIRWQNAVGGQDQRSEKEVADSMAIGGLGNTAGTVSKLRLLAEIGLALGKQMVDALKANLTRHRATDTLRDEDALGQSYVRLYRERRRKTTGRSRRQNQSYHPRSHQVLLPRRSSWQSWVIGSRFQVAGIMEEGIEVFGR